MHPTSILGELDGRTHEAASFSAISDDRAAVPCQHDAVHGSHDEARSVSLPALPGHVGFAHDESFECGDPGRGQPGLDRCALSLELYALARQWVNESHEFHAAGLLPDLQARRRRLRELFDRWGSATPREAVSPVRLVATPSAAEAVQLTAARTCPKTTDLVLVSMGKEPSDVPGVLHLKVVEM